MSKTKKITLRNFKAVSELEMDFKGCTAIVTGGNNRGKTSFLRGVMDRIRGMKPDLIVKQGEKDGRGEIELTTGEKFIWEFDIEGKDKLTFITREGIKTSVSKDLATRFFPKLFDVDAFIASEPKDQRAMLQKLAGVDFTQIDAEYKLAYTDRTAKKKLAETEMTRLEALPVPEKTEPVDVSELIRKKADIVNSNKPLETEYRKKVDAEDKRVKDFNDLQDAQQKKLDDFTKEKPVLENDIEVWKNEIERLQNKIIVHRAKLADGAELKAPEKKIGPDEVPFPKYESTAEIDLKLENATQINEKAAAWNKYQEQKAEVDKATLAAQVSDQAVKDIETRKKEMIKSANFPEGFSVSDDGILVDGFPLDENQISTSKKYCAALRLASIGLGEVRTLHFDASPLDKVSLAEIEAWAWENDLQLLIERPDFDSGEIKYELVETKNESK